MKNVVGSKVEASRRGKGMGPSCLITKAFSCHLACRTGFIIYLFFFISDSISSNYKNNGISIAICTIYIPVKPAIKEGPSPGSVASRGDRLGRAVTCGHLHK